jgi:hypothetical protein
LRIDDYFSRILGLVEDRSSVVAHSLQFDRRTDRTGFVCGKILFSDDKTLHIRECVDLDAEPRRLLYVYQFMGEDDSMSFRYDNSGHHKSVVTFPHQCDRSEGRLAFRRGTD